MNQVADALQRFRREGNLTQKAVGELLGVSQQAERLIESGAQLPSIHTLKRVAALFQWTAVEVGQFVLEVETKKKQPNRFRKVHTTAPEEKQP